MPTNDPNQPAVHEHQHVQDPDSPGYEVTDVNVSGVVVFLSGLMGFLVVFFIFCYVMGKVINTAIEKADGPTSKWNQLSAFTGAETTGGKKQNLASNPEMQQKQFQQMTTTFPSPRLDIDDGDQATADLHAREDLLLNHYSVDSAEAAGSIRIPISRAMEIIAQRGLPVMAQTPTAATQMAGDTVPVVQAPLTTGFARTGYELQVIATREQKMNYGKAEAASHAELAPTK